MTNDILQEILALTRANSTKLDQLTASVNRMDAAVSQLGITVSALDARDTNRRRAKRAYGSPFPYEPVPNYEGKTHPDVEIENPTIGDYHKATRAKRTAEDVLRDAEGGEDEQNAFDNLQAMKRHKKDVCSKLTGDALDGELPTLVRDLKDAMLKLTSSFLAFEARDANRRRYGRSEGVAFDYVPVPNENNKTHPEGCELIISSSDVPLLSEEELALWLEHYGASVAGERAAKEKRLGRCFLEKP
ncbi:hypothetical protein MNV49_003526 [Pseudohyphozyma bogoriensis]|nr:hypothetical protein MNV49_003526 [Pseudohyphozyma bogoriensis]